ncbi:hypothetical protein [Halomarina oriensis]|uniref:Uncharacterized protein n=1 Tax=Halomarina oriensis TaxID=671145 RepID=A0A6B0GNG1_9EURY|nr:hypothetical protein [Halomarina oriensis]MWG36220.1 hypothetical protein [Halomarina oriensis]
MSDRRSQEVQQDGDGQNVWIITVRDSDSGKWTRDVFMAYTLNNAKHQAKYAVRDTYDEPQVIYTEEVATDVSA